MNAGSHAVVAARYILRTQLGYEQIVATADKVNDWSYRVRCTSKRYPSRHASQKGLSAKRPHLFGFST